MATEDITVRMGLDKTGFDAGLSGAAKGIKMLAGYFGVGFGAGKVSAAAREMLQLASETNKLIQTSDEARIMFDQMTRGIQDVGNAANLTEKQLEDMREAASIFTARDLENIDKAGEKLAKVGEGLKWFGGKVASSIVELFRFASGFIAGEYREGWGGGESFASSQARSDQAVAKSLREEKERLKIMDEQKENRDWQKQMLAEEEYAIDQLRLKEQERLDIEREKLRLKIASLEKDQEAARAGRQRALSDRSGWSIAELASMDQSSPFFSQGAIPALIKARQIQWMEGKSKFERLRGNTGLANVISQEALKMRGELSPLTSSEGDPLPKLDEIKSELAALRELATGQGLIIQPRMSK